MAQVREFTLPDLGEGLTEATVVRWLVDVGGVVEVDQPVVEVETAKAMVEIPCPYAGVVTSHAVPEGAELPVGAPLLTVASGTAAGAGDSGAGSGDASADGAGAPGTGNGSRAESARPEPGGQDGGGADRSGNVLVGYGTQDAPRRRGRARRPARGAARGAEANGAGQEARTEPRTEPPAETREEGGPVPVISPLVRRLAREQGVDLRELTGSGPDGLIVRSDVERAAQARETARTRSRDTAQAQALETAQAQSREEAAAAPAGPGLAGRTEPERVPLTGVRGATAAKLSRAQREVPAATCWVDADATELLAARHAMNAGDRAPVSLLAVLARITVAALARFPELNSTVDTEAGAHGEIVRLPSVHLGLAAQTDRGLVVPVVRDAHARTTEQLSAEIARVTGAARDGTLTPADLTGGTFTLNNYGVFGVDGSTPLVNHPEAAMLGVGRIVEKPWAHQGELALRHVVQLSFTFDHRVCDGGTAGGFLRHVADCVEQPALLLRTL